MNRPAPAAAWLVALGLASPLIYGVAEQAVAARHGESWAAEPAVSRRIEAFLAPVVPGRHRGVMLGVSGGYCAFEDASLDAPNPVLPVAAIGQGLHETYPYIDTILRMRPDFLLIQGTALLTASAPPSPYRVARRRLEKRFLWPVLGWHDNFMEGVVAGVDLGICARMAAPPETWADDLRGDIEWVTRDAGAAARQRLIAVLAEIVDSGVPAFVFDQPRHRYAAAYFAVVDERVDALLSELGDRRRRLTVLRYPDVVPDTMFLEASHLSPMGAAAFRQRLLADVAASLPNPESAR
jgi:hypothetical protein